MPERSLQLEARISLIQVFHNIPFRAIDDIHKAYKMSLPKDEILNRSTMSKTKANYTANFGIGNYQQGRLMEKIKQCEYLTLYLDTSTFNQISEETGNKAKDLDIFIRLFNDVTNRSECHFLDVHFLAFETAEVQLNALLETLEKYSVDLKKVTQEGLY